MAQEQELSEQGWECLTYQGASRDANPDAEGPGRHAAARLADLTFHPSPEVSPGRGVEFQILDRESADLAPGAVRILPACAQDQVEGVTAELLQSMIEIKTGVCGGTLPRCVTRCCRASAGCGTSRRRWATTWRWAARTPSTFYTSTSTVYPAERDAPPVQERHGWLTYQILLRTARPRRDAGRRPGLGVTNLLVQYLPTCSPCPRIRPSGRGWTRGWRRAGRPFRDVPHASLPHYFATWKDFCTHRGDARMPGHPGDQGPVLGHSSPAAAGHVPLRICDMPSSLAHALALVALFIAWRSRAAPARRETSPPSRRPATVWIAPRTNGWPPGTFSRPVHSHPGGKRQPRT